MDFYLISRKSEINITENPRAELVRGIRSRTNLVVAYAFVTSVRLVRIFVFIPLWSWTEELEENCCQEDEGNNVHTIKGNQGQRTPQN